MCVGRGAQYLKDKVDAGADCIVTQLFYDVDNYFKWVGDCRAIGITVPIVPGIMPINTYAGWERMTGLCKTRIPPAMREALEAIRDNDEAVKTFGVQFVSDMCRRLLDGGAPGLHMYTLNLEKSVLEILRNLSLLNDSVARRALPWRPRLTEGRRLVTPPAPPHTTRPAVVARGRGHERAAGQAILRCLNAGPALSECGALSAWTGRRRCGPSTGRTGRAATSPAPSTGTSSPTVSAPRPSRRHRRARARKARGSSAAPRLPRGVGTGSTEEGGGGAVK